MHSNDVIKNSCKYTKARIESFYGLLVVWVLTCICLRLLHKKPVVCQTKTNKKEKERKKRREWLNKVCGAKIQEFSERSKKIIVDLIKTREWERKTEVSDIELRNSRIAILIATISNLSLYFSLEHKPQRKPFLFHCNCFLFQKHFDVNQWIYCVFSAIVYRDFFEGWLVTRSAIYFKVSEDDELSLGVYIENFILPWHWLLLCFF